MSGEPALRSSGSGDLGDLVESRPRAVSPRRRLLVACLVVVLVIVGATAWYVDGRRRVHEFSTLLRCVTVAESAWTIADARITSMASYVRPSVGLNPSLNVQHGLYALVADEAAVGVPSLRQALHGCRSVHVLAYHSKLRAARTAYVALLQAEVDRVAATATDGSQAFADSEGLTQLRSLARRDLSAAAPDEQARQSARRAMGAL